MSNQSTLGQVLAALFGYNSSPSLTETLAYALYFGVVLLGLRWVGASSTKEAVQAKT